MPPVGVNVVSELGFAGVHEVDGVDGLDEGIGSADDEGDSVGVGAFVVAGDGNGPLRIGDIAQWFPMGPDNALSRTLRGPFACLLHPRFECR